jgi:hypothetical protein
LSGEAFSGRDHPYICTVWAVDFEMPVCKFYLLYFLPNLLKKKENEEKKALLPAGVSKSEVNMVMYGLYVDFATPVGSSTFFFFSFSWATSAERNNK